MISYGKPVWGDVGHLFSARDQMRSAEELAALAGMGWHAERRPLYVQGSDGSMEPASGWHMLCRSDTGDHLRIVRSRFRPVRSSDLFARYLPWIAEGRAAFVAAGAPRNGDESQWLLLRVGDWIEIAPDDVAMPYVFVINPMTPAGGHGCHLVESIIFERRRTRVTLPQIELTRKACHLASNSVINLPLVPDLSDRIRAAAHLWQKSARIRVSRAESDEIIRAVVKRTTVGGRPPTPRQLYRLRAKAQAQLDSPWNLTRGVIGTLWSVVNAICEHVERPMHIRGASMHKRLFSYVMLDFGRVMKTWTLDQTIKRCNSDVA